MLTPHLLLRLFRLAAVGGAAVAVVLLLGPFSYDRLGLPFEDEVAHALLFYVASLSAFIALPKMRLNDLVAAALLLAGASELAQAFTGREMSLVDLAGDSVGVALAAAPFYAARFRSLIREDPFTPFSERARRDRRSPRREGERLGALPLARASQPPPLA